MDPVPGGGRFPLRDSSPEQEAGKTGRRRKRRSAGRPPPFFWKGRVLLKDLCRWPEKHAGGRTVRLRWEKNLCPLAQTAPAPVGDGAVCGKGGGGDGGRSSSRQRHRDKDPAGHGQEGRKGKPDAQGPGRLPGLSGKSDGAGVTCTVLWENQGEGLAGWREKEKVGKCPNAGWEPFRRPGGKTGRSSGRRPGRENGRCRLQAVEADQEPGKIPGLLIPDKAFVTGRSGRDGPEGTA